MTSINWHSVNSRSSPNRPQAQRHLDADYLDNLPLFSDLQLFVRLNTQNANRDLIVRYWRQMAQGQIKKSSVSAKPASRSSSNGVTKKHLGTKKSRNPRLIKAAKINKKFTSGLTAQTERMLGEKAGHTEMIGKTKKKGSDGTTPHGKKGGEKRKG